MAGLRLLRADLEGHAAISTREASWDPNVSRLRHRRGWIRRHGLGRVLEHREAKRSCRQSESNGKQLQLAHVTLLEEPDQPPQAASSSGHTGARSLSSPKRGIYEKYLARGRER